MEGNFGRLLKLHDLPFSETGRSRLKIGGPELGRCIGDLRCAFEGGGGWEPGGVGGEVGDGCEDFGGGRVDGNG